ncbi:MAG: PAS domain S-box protein [Bacillota bacterium]
MKIDRNTYNYKSLEALFKNSLDATIHIDQNYHIIDVNQAFLQLFEYAPEELLGKHVDDVMNMGKAGSANIKQTADVLAGKNVTDQGVRYNKNGQPIHVLIKGIPVLINGKMAGAFAIYVDITEQKKAEVKIKERESRFNAIFEGSHDAVTIVSDEGFFVDCNQRTVDLFGLESKDEFLMKRPADFSPLLQPDGNSSMDSSRLKIAEALDKNEHIHFEWLHQRKDGSTFPAEVILISYPLEGRIVLQGSIRDITARKEAAEKLRYISFHDSLTGLYNRNYLDEEMQRVDTSRQLPISIIIADLNGLKLINDTYSHATGDETIKAAAKILKKSTRKEDIIARWGGDEFLVLLPQTGTEETLQLCKRIHNVCKNVSVEDVPVSMAIGMATKTDMNQSLSDIMREAEDNMYNQKLTESRSAKSFLLRALLKTLSEKSFETDAHARRMQAVALEIGEALDLSEEELKRLSQLIILHDIGKINISEDILTRNGPLTEEEWLIMKKHPEIGYRIARATEEFAHVADDILAHHERWDGKGYPRGLKGEEISLLARITAIADAYEVMSKGRPYKKAMPPEELISEFKRCSGTQFDPKLVNIFLSLDLK